MITAQPRLVVSAPSSGHGKTAIAVGLLAALSGRGVPTAGFKVGPDHTDAAYLGLAAGRPGRNLDPRLVGAQRVAPLFAHGASGAQVAVIEGAMGLFDSLTGQPEIDGTASVAAALRAPVVLVIDVAAMGHSLAALVHGFRMFDEMVHLGGVILNRVASERHEQMLRSAMDDIGMPVLGALHRGDLPNVLPARTHGLVPVAHRTVEAGRAVRRLGEAVSGSLDMDRLMALAASAPPIPGPLWTPAEAAGDERFDQRPVIALAGGQGAPYTYVETAELLTAAGADVAVVDPLRDEALPPGTRALVVGAGLPEGYAEELSANRRLCAAVAQFARDGWPVVAEGVALPWLGRELDGRPMCGVLDATATTGEQTVAGYREATAPGTSVLAPAGARITGYKQHRAVVAPRHGANPAWTWSGGNPEGFVWRQVHASQLALHWAAAPEIARRLVAAAHAGPQGAQAPHGGPGAHGPQSAPSSHAPQNGMPSGPPAGHPGMPPAQGGPGGQPSGMPPARDAPAAPAPPMPPQSVPAGMLPGQGPGPAGQPYGMPSVPSGPPPGQGPGPSGSPLDMPPGQGSDSGGQPYGMPPGQGADPGLSYGMPPGQGTDPGLSYGMPSGQGHGSSGMPPGQGHGSSGMPQGQGHGPNGMPMGQGAGPHGMFPGQGSGVNGQTFGMPPGQNAGPAYGMPGSGTPSSGFPGSGMPGSGYPNSVMPAFSDVDAPESGAPTRVMPAPGMSSGPGSGMPPGHSGMPPGRMPFDGSHPGQGMPPHPGQGGPPGHILPTGSMPQIQIMTNQPDTGVVLSGQILPPAASSGPGMPPPRDGHPDDMPVR